MTRILSISWLAGLLAAAAGCCSNGDRPRLFGRPSPPPPQPAFITQPTPIVSPAPGIQQSSFPVVPQGPPTAPPPVVPQIQPAPSISQSPPARVETQWQPTEGRDAPPRVEPNRSEPPRIESNRDAGPRIQLYAPEVIDKDDRPQDRKPSVQGSLPAIPQFVVAKDNVFAGLRPKLGGLDWLQSNGVKTVIHLQAPGQDDSADRTQIEKRNMRYLAFEVSPQTLTQEKADEFIKLIRDVGKQSTFLYDEDGALTGAMWYLHLRLGESLNDDASLIRAQQLGLQNDRDGIHRNMWVAVQKLLSENSR